MPPYVAVYGVYAGLGCAWTKTDTSPVSGTHVLSLSIPDVSLSNALAWKVAARTSAEADVCVALAPEYTYVCCLGISSPSRRWLRDVLERRQSTGCVVTLRKRRLKLEDAAGAKL